MIKILRRNFRLDLILPTSILLISGACASNAPTVDPSSSASPGPSSPSTASSTSSLVAPSGTDPAASEFASMGGTPAGSVKKMTTDGAHPRIPSQTSRSVKPCAASPALADAAGAIQTCLDQAADGDTLTLAPGVYTLRTALTVRHSGAITTANAASGLKCRDNAGLACAELRAGPSVSSMDRGFIKVAASAVTFQALVINGNKQARFNSPEASQCRAGNNGQGINIHTDGTQFQFINSSTVNALCGSGLEVGGISEGLRIQESFIANNGTHNSQMLWSDGATIADSKNAEISNNEIRDNTDVDLIFGGCQDCLIQNNTITHSSAFASSSFAALMLQAWPKGATSGNYTGSQISANTIDCATFRCGFGLLIGSNSWYVAPSFGGTYSGNRISGAQSGFAINDATGPLQVGANTVERSGGKFLTSGGTTVLAAYALSKKSTAFVQWIGSASVQGWSAQDLTGQIPNWWTKDVVITSGAF